MRKILLLLVGLLISQTLWADIGVRASLGRGNPDRLRGSRIAMTWDWHNNLLNPDSFWRLVTYWDLSIAHWHTDVSNPPGPRGLNAFAIAPVLRLQPKAPLQLNILPFAEISVGGSWLTNTRLAHRDLGSHLEFQDLIGLGTRFGQNQAYELSWHYLHYSNANLSPPNNGIDVKILATLGYHFG